MKPINQSLLQKVLDAAEVATQPEYWEFRGELDKLARSLPDVLEIPGNETRSRHGFRLNVEVANLYESLKDAMHLVQLARESQFGFEGPLVNAAADHLRVALDSARNIAVRCG